MKKAVLSLVIVCGLVGAVSVRAALLPSQVGGLTMWLQGESLVLNSGDAVSLWPDSSVPAYNATQATALYQPVYRENTTVNNQRPAVQFSADFLGANTLPVLADATVMAFFRTDLDNFRIAFHNQPGNADRWGSYTNTTFAANDWHLLTFTINTSDPGTASSYRMNGVDLAQTLGNRHVYDIAADSIRPLFGYTQSNQNTAEQILHLTTLTTTAPNTYEPTTAFFSNSRNVGAYYATSKKMYFTGDIAELLVFDSVLDGATIAALEQYLTIKYTYAVPEPTTAMLLGLGLVAALARRRRRR